MKAMKAKKAKKVTTGTLINKLERNIAVANMRGDNAAADGFQKLLTIAINSTQAPKVIA